MIDSFIYWIGVIVSLTSVLAFVVFIVGRTIEYTLEKFDLTMKFVYFARDMRRRKRTGE